MILYHYTTLMGAIGIAKTERIFKGRCISQDGKSTISDFAVNLTTSQSCIGHGLHLGNIITKELAYKISKEHPNSLYLEKPKKPSGDYKLLDHSQIRFEIEIHENDKDAIKCTDFYKNNPETIFFLAASGHNPLLGYLEDNEFLSFIKKFKSGSMGNMSQSWYYYKNEIIATQTKVAISSNFNEYSNSMEFSDFKNTIDAEMAQQAQPSK